MPIRPELRHHYTGPEWEAVRARILARATREVATQNLGAAEDVPTVARFPCCESCGAPDRWFRLNEAETYWQEDHIRDIARRNGCDDTGAAFVGMTRIILTIAHLNHNPADNRDENLQALCQRCHLRYDRDHHNHTRRANLRARQDAGAALFKEPRA